ncbi:MAG: DUF305 domain-containing protein [Patescibacteria group bacterium]
MTQNKPTKIVLLTYLSTLALFIGTAFVSGAIVHTGNISELYKYLVIGAIGIGLFIAGSFAQELISNGKSLKSEGIFKFFMFSLMLSVGIGMISGGTQHFSDFPLYSSYLIPLGLIVSYFAFLLKNNFQFTKNLIIVGFVLTGIAGAGFFGLSAYAKNLTEQASKDKAALCKTSYNPFVINVQASVGHDETSCSTASTNTTKTNTTTEVHDMSSMVTNNQSFIDNMIPHHQEAINTSYTIQATTQDPELKQFATSVITSQTKEVTQMKEWYKLWFNKEYTDNTSYIPMMTKMNGLSGNQLDKAYIEGMIGHHKGAIQMAEKILTIKDAKAEVATLSNNIIKDQNKEIDILNGLLKTKFAQTPSTNTNSSKSQSPASTPKVDSDGHTGH